MSRTLQLAEQLISRKFNCGGLLVRSTILTPGLALRLPNSLSCYLREPVFQNIAGLMIKAHQRTTDNTSIPQRDYARGDTIPLPQALRAAFLHHSNRLTATDEIT